ncbi:MAG: MarR family transcriptional regulator [Arenicellales bacterium]|nr:MarR family transcriptional regulator [Arenicellales bacterium]
MSARTAKHSTIDGNGRSSGTGKPALRAWLRLWSCVGTVERVIRTRLHLGYGMTLARFDYLSQLYREPALRLTMTELSHRLMVSGGNVTGLTDRLVTDGLVVREQDPADRRVQIIALTGHGHELFTEVARAHEVWIRELLGSLNSEDVKGLNHTLGRLKHALDDEWIEKRGE